MQETRQEFVGIVKKCYREGKVSDELIRDLVSNERTMETIYLTEEEYETITGKKY